MESSGKRRTRPVADRTEQENEDSRLAEARRQKMQSAVWPTNDEDAAIIAAALTDPDCPPLAEGAIAQFKPARPRGRPAQASTKIPTTMRLDNDVLDSFKATGDGWQTRMNNALRTYLTTNHMLVRRFHATVHRRGKETDQLGEFLVVAIDGGQARTKVKNHLLRLGREDAARGYVYTVEIGNARMADLELIY